MQARESPESKYHTLHNEQAFQMIRCDDLVKRQLSVGFDEWC
jgi:hypothetical protein